MDDGHKSILQRRRYCGVPQLVINIRSQVIQYVLVTHLCCQCQSFVTLGSIYLDADLSMRAHITATVRTCFAAQRQIRSVRRSLTLDALLTLLQA